MQDTLRQYLTISRPRFWPYLLGPYVVGIAAGSSQQDTLVAPLAWIVIIGLFFTYPANFIIYGINDVYDYDTDKLNPKKRGYEALVKPEARWMVMRHALAWLVIGYLLLEFVPGYNDPAAWALLGFYAFGVLYSMPPVRAKTKPFLDSVFNVLYVMPALVGYGLAADRFPQWQLLVAAGLWCMAMHAYSAIPDIAADKKAKLNTVATVLGARGTLIFCTLCYAGAAMLSYKWLGVFALAAGSVYLTMMSVTRLDPARDRVFKLYRYFPYLNMLVGMALFFWIILKY